MSADGRQLLDDGVIVYTGPVAEGTKFMKRDGYYYLIIPEGGVGGGWQTVLRSRNIYGPYEKRVVLEQGSTAINGPHQGALVDTPDGSWWFLHFQETHPRGRVVHLQPARWKDGWPLMGVDIDGNGIGEPVDVWTSPVATSPLPLPTSDEFSGDHQYWVGQHQRSLSLQWQWNHNPVDDGWSLSEHRGWLTLHALPAADIMHSRNSLTQKTLGYKSQATTKVDCSSLNDGDCAGLLCMGNLFMGVGVINENGRLTFFTEHNGKRNMLNACNKKTVYLRVNIDSRQNSHQFEVSTDGRSFTPVGEPFSLRMGNWKGSRVGLFCYATGEKGGKAKFDYFHYDIQQ